MRSTILFITLFVFVQPAIAGAQIGPAAGSYSVDVKFPEAIERRMSSINNLEQVFEERFRENRNDGTTLLETGTQRFADIQTAGTEWAGERLIDDVADYTLDNLVKSMVAYNVTRAVPDFSGSIEVTIDRLKLSNPSIAILEWSESYARGRVKVTSADGSVLFDEAVRVNLVVDSTVDSAFAGPELAFVETDPSKRVGPVLAYFVERALEQVWPEHAEDFVGPVIVRVSQPNERLTFN